jgi:hypothetical protein
VINIYKKEMTEQKPPDDPKYYADMILYYKKGHPACDSLKNEVLPYNEVILQDVSEIPPDQRPSWLVGVPTVVVLPSYDILTGTDAVQFVRNWQHSKPQATEPMNATVRTAPIGHDSRYSDTPTEKSADVNQTLENLIRMRGKQL